MSFSAPSSCTFASILCSMRFLIASMSIDSSSGVRFSSVPSVNGKKKDFWLDFSQDFGE